MVLSDQMVAALDACTALTREKGERGRREAAREAWCCNCRQWLPYSAFRPSVRYRNGCAAACRNCHARMNREWRERNPDVVEAYNEARRIGRVSANASTAARRSSPAYAGRLQIAVLTADDSARSSNGERLVPEFVRAPA
jgi:hypothetical protein